MKDIFGTIGKILSWIFAALVIAFTSLLTWLLAQRIIPGDTVLDIVLQVMVLILFDGGALVWFTTFLTVAKGTAQWALSGVGFVVGLLGAIIMAAGELILGQSLVVIDDPTRMSWILISTVVMAALVHATLIYLFHFSDPATKNRIENAQKVSQAIERAYADARGEIDRQIDSLTAQLVDSVVDEARRQIGAVTALHVRRGGELEAQIGETLRGGPVVDGAIKDVPPKPHKHPMSANGNSPVKMPTSSSDSGNPTPPPQSS